MTDDEMLAFVRSLGINARTVISSLVADEVETVRTAVPADRSSSRVVRRLAPRARVPAASADSATVASADLRQFSGSTAADARRDSVPAAHDAAADAVGTSERYEEWLRAGTTWLRSAGVVRTRHADFLHSLFDSGFIWAPLDVQLFEYAPTDEWLEEILARAESVLDQLTKEPAWPTAFEGEDLTIILTLRGERMTAWVGRGLVGLLVSFHPTEFDLAYRQGDVDAVLAVGVAISWFIDLCIRIDRTGPPGMRRGRARHRSPLSRGSITYVPTPTFQRDVETLAHGQRESLRAHRVKGHKRRLPPDWSPTESARHRAPAYIRRGMGPHETFVREHARGLDHSQERLVTHLSRYSSLADALGTAARLG